MVGVIRERYSSGGKSCCLAVGGSLVRSHPGCVEVSLSKTSNPQLLLTSWLVPCMAANRRWCVNVCVNVWMRGINCKVLWIKALYKCSPFIIYHLPFTKLELTLTLDDQLFPLWSKSPKEYFLRIKYNIIKYICCKYIKILTYILYKQNQD